MVVLFWMVPIPRGTVLERHVCYSEPQTSYLNLLITLRLSSVSEQYSIRTH